MATSLDSIIDALSADERALVESRAADLIAEEATLRDLRRALALTQIDVAARLGVGQDNISRLEQRSDLLLSTLASYIEALGGRLELVARFPDRPSVKLGGLAQLDVSGTVDAKGGERGAE
ncbi:MAG: XRE family transcriptional regulator [Azospirillaceae bacterium]